MKFLILLFFTIILNISFTQNQESNNLELLNSSDLKITNLKVDSIKKVIKYAINDSVLIDAWQSWDDLIYLEDPELDLILNKKILNLSNKIINSKKSASKIDFFIYKKAYALNNLGLIYTGKGLNLLAIENFVQCILLYEKIENDKGIADVNNNIGMVYYNQAIFPKSLEYYEKSLEQFEKMNDTNGIATVSTNIGLVYNDMKDYSTARTYIHAGYKYIRLGDDKLAIANALASIADTYIHSEDYENAMNFYKKALLLQEKLGHKRGIAFCLYGIGNSLYFLKDYNRSIDYCNKALRIAQEINAIRETTIVLQLLYKVYKANNQIEDALEMFELYIVMKDGIDNENNNKELISKEYKYQYAKEHLKDSLNFVKQVEINKKEHQIRIEREEKRRYLLYGGIGFLLIIGGISLRGYQRKKKDNYLILEQKRIKEQFLANTSHEIRAPLQSIIGNSDLLLLTRNSENKEIVSTINNSGKHLLNIVNDILDISKIDSGKIELERIPVSVRALLLEVTGLFSNLVNEKNIELDLLVSNEVPQTIITDPTRLKQILINLITNAIKFTHEGFVMLSLDVNNQKLIFSVKDSGVGINKEKLVTIFDKFTQENKSTTRLYGGTGLGLNISKYLIELMDGTITVESVLNEGTEFNFNLPLEVSHEIIKSKNESFIDLRNKNILIVDDNSMSSSTIAKQVSFFKANVNLSPNGDHALKRTLAKHFDVVLLDFNLPDINGVEIAKIIRNNPSFHQPKIVFISGKINEFIKNMVVDVRIYGFLTKPFDLYELNEMLIELFPKQPLISNQLFEINSMKNLDSIEETFLGEVPDLLNEIKKNIESLNIKKINFLIHKIKPCYYYINEHDLYDFIDEFEQHFSSYSENEIIEKVEYITGITNKIIQKIKSK